ncbi:hypothetical protein NBRC116494_00920 [Aurantivibrio plasticivorans]
MQTSDHDLRLTSMTMPDQQNIKRLVEKILVNQSVQAGIAASLDSDEGGSCESNVTPVNIQVINIEIHDTDLNDALGKVTLTRNIPVVILPASYGTTLRSDIGLNAGQKGNEKQASVNDEQEHAISVGGLKINRQQRKVWYKNIECELTPKEFELLWIFMRYPKRVFSRRELVSEIWGVDFDGYEHTVSNHMNRLRKKLSQVSDGVLSIDTVWGVGYRFDAGG